MKNLTVFLVKTVVLFLVFWLISSITKDNNNVAALPDWSVWLILAAVAALFDYIVDIVVRKDSPLASYMQFTVPNRA